MGCAHSDSPLRSTGDPEHQPAPAPAPAPVPSKRVYPPELKLAAVQAFLDEGLTRREVVERFELTSSSTLKKWVIAYRREGACALQKKITNNTSKRVPPTFDPLDPEKGYRLRKENLRLTGKLKN